MTEPTFGVRLAATQEQAWVTAAWLHGEVQLSRYADQDAGTRLWWAFRAIDATVRWRARTGILVAHPYAELTSPVAFVVWQQPKEWEHPYVCWVHVDHGWRGQGLATELLRCVIPVTCGRVVTSGMTPGGLAALKAARVACEPTVSPWALWELAARRDVGRPSVEYETRMLRAAAEAGLVEPYVHGNNGKLSLGAGKHVALARICGKVES